MSACWTRAPRPAAPTREAAPPAPPAPPPARDLPQSETCDHCGSDDTWWRSCKLLCRGCGAIVKSCADL